MQECPIDYYCDNLIFNADKSCWAVFSLVGFDYDYLSNEGKIKILYKTARFLTGIMSEAQILILPVGQDLKEHFKTLKSRVSKDDPLYEKTLNFTNLTEKYLNDLIVARGSTNDYRTYIIVKMETQEEAQDALKLKDKYEYFMQNPINAINVWMNLDTRDIIKRKINLCIKMADNWLRSQNARMEMIKSNTEEVQWLLRRIAYRGLNKNIKLFYESLDKKSPWQPISEDIKIDKEEVVRPLKRDIVNLFKGQIKTKNRLLTVETEDGVSYQTFLAITHIPDFDFPDVEWIYHLQQCDSQAELCIHIKATEYRAGLKKVDSKKREIDSQWEHIEQAAGEIPDDLAEGKDYANELEGELKASRSPLLNTSIIICLASDNQEELEQKAILIKNEYEDMQFGIERPRTDQRKLFMQFIPSVGVTVRDYVKPLTPKQLASGVIGATHEIGHKQGPYIATTGYEEKNVFFDMGLACLMNKSAAATFFGALGYGKSFNANLLAVLNVIYGGYSLIFDPKGERGHWKNDLKILDGLITTISLSADRKYRGMLDAYNLYRNDIDQANELAINVIAELLKLNPSEDKYTALLQAAKILKEKVANNEMVASTMALIKVLGDFDPNEEFYKEARSLSKRIDLEKENGMCQLLIGDGTEESLKIDNRMNIIQIQNLKLPSPEAQKEDYTVEEIRSTVVMSVLSHFAKQFALVPRKVFKLILFDESWSLGKTVEGVKLFDFLSRMGRSLFTGCIFNGHSVLDIPTEEIKNTITYKFCFHTDNENEAGRMLDYLGLENTPENRDEIMNLKNAECFFRDMNGRVGKIKFDAVFEDLIEVFDTTPKTEEKPKEKTTKKEPEKKKIGRVKNIPEVPNADNFIMPDVVESIDIYQREEI